MFTLAHLFQVGQQMKMRSMPRRRAAQEPEAMRQPPTRPIRLHRMALSGHCHRVELFLSLLGLPCERVDVDLAAGQHKQPAFLALNRFGQVPVINCRK